MAEQRITQEQLLSASVNADAKARLTQEQLLSLGVNSATLARLSQEQLLSLGVNSATLARVSQVVFLSITPRPATGCAAPWTIPTPTAFPFPSAGGPQYAYFEELEPAWGEFGHDFDDLTPAFNTIQSARIRRFAIEYDGLDEADAAVLDDHYDSTRGGLSFSITVPRTAEVITKVRYESYSRSAHTRVWAQTRSIRLIKYTN